MKTKHMLMACILTGTITPSSATPDDQTLEQTRQLIHWAQKNPEKSKLFGKILKKINQATEQDDQLRFGTQDNPEPFNFLAQVTKQVGQSIEQVKEWAEWIKKNTKTESAITDVIDGAAGGIVTTHTIMKPENGNTVTITKSYGPWEFRVHKPDSHHTS